jgi:small subunit ribosomal protein S8
MNTDPVADMITRIRNAGMVAMPTTSVPCSKVKIELARVLKETGFITDYKVIDRETRIGKDIKVFLKYTENEKSVITGIKRVSKCGRRIYYSHNNIPRILRGMGVIVMSTSKGLMTDHQARKIKQGGEALIAVW